MPRRETYDRGATDLEQWGNGRVFDVLYAYPDDSSTPARLMLAGPGWFLELPHRPARAAEEAVGGTGMTGPAGTRALAGSRISGMHVRT
ncbi:MAG: hypothetical protein WBH47_05875 [Streptosporangiaceae bacterium]